MKTSLINPNQLRHFGVQVQDKPTSHLPLSIVTEDHDFSMNMTMARTIVYTETHIPSDHKLATCKYIELTSSHSWDPNNVCFPHPKISLEEMMANKQFISSMTTFDLSRSQGDHDIDNANDHTIFDLNNIQRHICSMSSMNSSLFKTQDMNLGSTDIPLTSRFQSSERHSDVSAQSLLSEQWGNSISTAGKNLKRLRNSSCITPSSH
jgi:hypothetical protein